MSIACDEHELAIVTTIGIDGDLALATTSTPLVSFKGGSEAILA